MVWLGVAADPRRHARDIEERARAQFREGLLDEAAGLLARYPEDLRPFGAMGYREAFEVIAGQRSDVAVPVSCRGPVGIAASAIPDPHRQRNALLQALQQ